MTVPPGESEDSSASAQDQLCNWYLAHLRRRAYHDEGQLNLTPAALMAVDRAGIERLIAKKAAEQSDGPEYALAVKPHQSGPSLIRISLIIGLMAFAVLLTLCLIGGIAASRSGAGSEGLRTVSTILGAGVIVAIGGLLGEVLLLKVIGRLAALRERTSRLSALERGDPLMSGDEIACLEHLLCKQSAELSDRRNKERAIVEYADEVLCSVDGDFRIVSVNLATSRLWGYLDHELLGRKVTEFCVVEDRQKLEKFLLDCKSKKGGVDLESRLHTKSGSVIDLSWHIEWSATSQVYYCVADDITERKQVERLKQEFVAMLSHDLRSPLTSVLGTISLLQKDVLGELNEAGKRRVQNAERVGRHLIQLINDLLDIDKIEQGHFELKLDQFPVSELCEEAIEAVVVLAEQKSIKLESPQTTMQLFADRSRLLRVLINLLSNAIKFSPAGSVVSIETDESPDSVEIGVRDRGRGISSKDREKIFDRFRQTQVTDATVHGGSGLGLAICKGIVECHGGTISVDSEEGKGSVFKFRLAGQQASGSLHRQ